MSEEEKKAKRKAYQKWYYETYTKRRRENGVKPKSTYKKKSALEKEISFKRAARKRRHTMLERYGRDGVAEIYRINGERLARQMEENPDRRYRIDSEKAKEMSVLGVEARRKKSKHASVRAKAKEEQ